MGPGGGTDALHQSSVWVSAMKPLDLKGQRFGRLVARDLEDTGTKRSPMKWRCDCDCGKQAIIVPHNLVAGNTRSCGCLRLDRVREVCSTHGQTVSRTYNIWINMRQRCGNPKHPEFHFWGGRGITVCDAWSASFEAFLVDMGECPSGMSIDRKENDKGYGPDNCVWASSKEQANNRRSNHLITIDGVTLSIAMWAEKSGIPYGVLNHRVARKWPEHRMLEAPRRW